MNRRKVLPEVKGGAEWERERERERERVLWFEIIELVESKWWKEIGNV